MKKIINLSLVLVSFLWLSGCFSEQQYSGKVARETQLGLIEPGKTTKADVFELLGSPSSKGSFGRNIWYYVGEYKTQTAFLEAKTKNRHVVAINFNDKDIVSSVDRKTLSDGKEVKSVKGATPSYGSKKGIAEELFGHVQLSPLPTGDDMQ